MMAENLGDAKQRLYSSNNNNMKTTQYPEDEILKHSDVQECTFKPKINNMSKWIDKKCNDDRQPRSDQ